TGGSSGHLGDPPTPPTAARSPTRRPGSPGHLSFATVDPLNLSAHRLIIRAAGRRQGKPARHCRLAAVQVVAVADPAPGRCRYRRCTGTGYDTRRPPPPAPDPA